MLSGKTRLDLGKLPGYHNANHKVHDVITEAALDVEAKAKTNAQAQGVVDTGALVNSISTSDTGASVQVGPTVDYAIYNELGTYKLPARPFLVPAFDEVKADLPDRLKEVIS